MLSSPSLFYLITSFIRLLASHTESTILSRMWPLFETVSTKGMLFTLKSILAVELNSSAPAPEENPPVLIARCVHSKRQQGLVSHAHPRQPSLRRSRPSTTAPSHSLPQNYITRPSIAACLSAFSTHKPHELILRALTAVRYGEKLAVKDKCLMLVLQRGKSGTVNRATFTRTGTATVHFVVAAL